MYCLLHTIYIYIYNWASSLFFSCDFDLPWGFDCWGLDRWGGFDPDSFYRSSVSDRDAPGISSRGVGDEKKQAVVQPPSETNTKTFNFLGVPSDKPVSAISAVHGAL